MYDPNTFLHGTQYADSGVFRSIHTKNPGKKLRMESERLSEIERTNRILYQRMVEIAHRPHFSTGKFSTDSNL